MAARILYFGRDTCHRLPVLVRAGYAVDNCTTFEEMRPILSFEPALAAILMADTSPRAAQPAIAWLHCHFSPPLILFRDSYRLLAEAAFDLVIPTLTPPGEWLADIATVIARRRLSPIDLAPDPPRPPALRSPFRDDYMSI